MKKLSWIGAAAVIPLVLAAFTPGAYADTLESDLVSTVERGHQVDNEGFVSLPYSTSQTLDFTYYVMEGNQGGLKGCDATVDSPAKVSIEAIDGVRVSSSNFDLVGCSTPEGTTYKKTVTYTFTKPGRYQIPAAVTDTTGEYTTSGATVKVRVAEAPRDTTAPTITAAIDETANAAGWYRERPTVTFTCADEIGGSGLFSCSGPVTLGDGANQTVTGSARDIAGNTSSKTLTGLHVDTVAPSIGYTLDKTKNANGWFNTKPTATFSCSDDLSGVAPLGCSPAKTFDEGENQSATGTATDVAGNQSTVTVSNIDVDLTKPAISGAPTSAAASTGWYNLATGAPVIDFTCTDALSGVAEADCQADKTLGEGAAVTADGTATDRAGNSTTTTTDPVKVDLTKPTITGGVDKTPAATGWYNKTTGAPTVAFTCSDTGSGIGSGACPASTLVAEGTSQSVTGNVADIAGNPADSVSVSGLKVDLTPPTLNITGGPQVDAVMLSKGFNLPTYDFGATVPVPDCIPTDAVSGPASPRCTVSAVDTSVGVHEFVLSAADVAGNVKTTSIQYEVKAFRYEGFFSPVEMDRLNTVKGGSTVPLKFKVYGGATDALVTDVNMIRTFSTKTALCGSMTPDPVDITNTGSTSLRFDTTAGQFIQNWQTPKSQGCWNLTLILGDGTVIKNRTTGLVPQFQLK